MKRVRIGIIGVGNMGSEHVRMIRDHCPELEVVAVADIREERRQWARKNLPETAAIYDNAEAMLDSGLIDAAIVAVPHYDHPKYAMACFERHLHVLVEKPAGVYTRQVKEMNRAADKANVVFALMFNQRTDHIYRKMRELVQGGSLGRIRRTNWIITNWYRPQSYYDSGSWRATWKGEGGGVLLNQCPHNLDLWQWICGMPVKVDAHLHFGKWHNIEVEDDVTAYVEYASPDGSGQGATGVFVTSTADLPGTNRFEITLDKGKLLAEDGKLMLWELDRPEPEINRMSATAFVSPKITATQVETDGKSEQHVGVLNAFAAAILRGEPLIADGREGINGLTLSNAMHLSQWLGRPVDVPFDDDLYYEELMKRVRASVEKSNVREITADMSSSYNTNK